MTIEKLWEYTCSGENEKLQEYYNNGGETNRRYKAFGKFHSLIAGAYRNGNTETVLLLIDNGETILESEKEEIKLINIYMENLMFHDVRIESGYYGGFQFYVEERYSNYFDLDKDSEYCIDNEDAHYYFDMCRSKAIRAADAEKRKIERWLESLVNEGFVILVCTARFSNGEAHYAIRNNRTRMLAAVNGN